MEKYYDISEVCRIFGLAPSGIRYYEEQGLIHPKRTESGRRKYAMEEMRMLMHIKSLRVCGIGLNEISAAFTNVTSASIEDARQHFQTTLMDIQRQIDLLQTSEKRLKEYLDKLNKPDEELSFLGEVNVSPIYMLHLDPLFGQNAQEQSALAEWMKLVPSVRKMTEYVLEGDTLRSTCDYFCVHQQTADTFALPMREKAVALPAQPAIKIGFQTLHTGIRGFSAEDLRTIASLVRTHNKQWRSIRILSAFLFGNIENEQKKKHYEIWVMPV